MAMYARWTGCTYEDYLRDEINRQNFALALTNIKTMLVECMRPVCEAATATIEWLRETFAAVDLSNVTTMLDWAKENAPQIVERHADDALDALTYSCGIDLAHGPDMAAGGGGND
ncbi:MAG: hypothetical protein IKY92_03695 [Akkermansia sp.]|nr:hypothetical protein [Akkermansia sp.]